MIGSRSETNAVWITGANGLIGNALIKVAPASVIKIFGLHRNDLDLTEFSSVREKFRKQNPSLILHCAAVSKVPACQANPALAWKTNVDATRNLAELAADIPFIFFSTDLVFDGQKGNYAEADELNPLNIYAETKCAAEKVVLQNPRHTVIRTSLNGGISPTSDRGFNEELYGAWQSGRTTKLFTDEFRCPVAATVTARAIWELVERKQSGLFHLAGSEKLSRLQIGTLLAAHHPELNPKIEAGSLSEYEGEPRSPNTSLNCDKIQRLLSFKLPVFTEWLCENAEEF